jgi:hypothetical protein
MVATPPVFYLAIHPFPRTSCSTTNNSIFVCSTMAIVHSTQKMGWPVKPLFTFGIRKHRSPFDTGSSQRSHGVSFPHVCAAGVPVEMVNNDGVLPFGFATEQPLVSAREDVKDVFQASCSRLELFGAPLGAGLRIPVLELFVDQGDAGHEVVRRRNPGVDQFPPGAVNRAVAPVTPLR